MYRWSDNMTKILQEHLLSDHCYDIMQDLLVVVIRTIQTTLCIGESLKETQESWL